MIHQTSLSSEIEFFDYNTLNLEVRIEVQQQTTELKSLVGQTAQNIISVGEKLVAVKSKLGHGNFRKWLKSEFGWSIPTARRFMRVYDRFKSFNLNHLNIATSALYLLAEPATPVEALKEALDRAALGEAISHGKSKEIIAQQKASVINGFKGTVEQQSSRHVELSPALKSSICPESPARSAPEREIVSKAVTVACLNPSPEGEKSVLKQQLPEDFTEAIAEVQSTPHNCIRVLSMEWHHFEQSEETMQIFEIVSDMVHAKVACFPSTIIAILQHLSSHPLQVTDFLEVTSKN
ncbi:MAG: DUF3102 domain-containing protein [Chroococcidiopsidaceae cyanobacterium CP_BM_ER_R8_30]|nr:DUF3102 domain-containing protein [Chroococcidiopsidaceae cyanobacterium CP_BM_ER_R8_30]